MIRIMCDQDVQGIRKLKVDRTYLELSAERLMEKLIDIEALGGAGRIYIP